MSPSGATLSALGCYLLVSLLFVFCTMIEFAFVLALHQIEKLETVDNTSLVIGMKNINNGITKPRIINRDITKISQKLGGDENTKYKTDEGMEKVGCRQRFLRLFKSMPSTTRIDLFSFSVFNLMYFAMNCIYWTHFL